MANISSVGHTWEEVRSKIFTPEEMAESDLRIALISELIKARQERGITQRELEAMSGVRQPIIARMENGNTTPNLSTVLKVLAPLGKTLYIGDLPKKNDAIRIILIKSGLTNAAVCPNPPLILFG